MSGGTCAGCNGPTDENNVCHACEVELPLDEARAEGREEERAAIVAWLRREADFADLATLGDPNGFAGRLFRAAANSVETGVHLKPEDGT